MADPKSYYTSKPLLDLLNKALAEHKTDMKSVAVAAGVGPANVRVFMDGRRKFLRASTMEAIGGVLGLTPEELRAASNTKRARRRRVVSDPAPTDQDTPDRSLAAHMRDVAYADHMREAAADAEKAAEEQKLLTYTMPRRALLLPAEERIALRQRIADLVDEALDLLA
jgi:DNA-binding Xre family transcriptional regulator